MYGPIAPLEYFRLLVQDPARIPLLEAAAAIALDACPELDLQQVLIDFDRLAAGLAVQCRGASTEATRLRRLLGYVYESEGFAGNTEAYYAAENSYIHRVLETRRGIPITLGLVVVELARHVGLEAEGVSFPGHFLVRVNLQDGVVVLDPFTGQTLDRGEIERRAEPYGASLGQLLQPAPAREILLRMLRNLRAIHEQAGEEAFLEGVWRRMQILGESG